MKDKWDDDEELISKDDDDSNFERKEIDDFDNRYWEIVQTVDGGLRVGALFTYRDILYTTETCPDLEGTVFKNKKTGKLHVMKNIEINSKKIIAKANAELSKTDVQHLLYGLDNTRDSVFLLAKRIKRLPACSRGLFKKYAFYKMLCLYVGEELCDPR